MPVAGSRADTLAGRTDLQVEEDTVDFQPPRPVPNGDESEYYVSRNFCVFAMTARNVGRMSATYGRLKKSKSKDWGIDPEFLQLGAAINAWFGELPPDLAISYPPDGSPPWLPSAFAGNVHSYYYLSIILFNRPQLAFLQPGAVGGQWKHHMLLSYNAAKNLCRLQEAVVNTYGLQGLQCMQRGINFTIYAVLACIVLHLVWTLSRSIFGGFANVVLGGLDISGSSAEQRRARILYTTYADPRKVHGRVADARHATTSRLDSSSLFGRRQETLCSQAELSVREPELVDALKPAWPVPSGSSSVRVHGAAG